MSGSTNIQELNTNLENNSNKNYLPWILGGLGGLGLVGVIVYFLAKKNKENN